MLSSLMFTFQRSGSQSLKKDVLGYKADPPPEKKAHLFSKICAHTHLKERESIYNYNFSQVNVLRTGRGGLSFPLLSTGLIKPHIFNLYLPSHLLYCFCRKYKDLNLVDCVAAV